MRASVAAALCLMAGSFCLPAAAQSLPLELSWQAPDECPSAERIRSDLSRITRPRAGRELAPLSARAVITHGASGYHLVLETEREGTLNRAQVDGSTCASLGRAATLMLALAYGDGAEVITSDERATSDAPDTRPKSAPPDAAAKPPLASASPARASVPVRREAPRATLEVTPWAGATLSSGFVAAAALGVEVGLQAGTRYWLAAFRVRATPSTEAARKDALEVRLSSTSLALGGCARLPFGALRVAGCASLGAGVLRASSRGARREGSASPTFIALTPSVLAQYRFSPHWALRAELGAQVPFSRAEFVVDGEGVLYRTSSAAPELGTGIEWSF